MIFPDSLRFYATTKQHPVAPNATGADRNLDEKPRNGEYAPKLHIMSRGPLRVITATLTPCHDVKCAFPCTILLYTIKAVPMSMEELDRDIQN